MANYTILLIDYEPRSIERFRQPLVSAGYTVEIATDGLAGIEAFNRLNPDMVLVEAMIPKKHGFEVCQELKRTPHGRRTPIIITTGVYKGRKYRTQALHIYGCDEYIEKPIAPEQLLAVVGKFFGGANPASASSHPSVEASAAGTDLTLDPGPAALPTPARKHEPSASGSGSPQMKAAIAPTAVANDLTEEEIMARLDEILPGGDTFRSDAESAAAMAGLEPIDLSEAEVDVDPFGRMRDELSSELGALSAALAIDPAPVLEPEAVAAPFPSDEAPSVSLLESLPVPESKVQAPREVEVRSSGGETVHSREGQVVHFDAKRGKKSKKNGRKGPHGRTQQQPAPAIAAIPAAQVSAAPAAQSAPEIVVPYGTLVETELGVTAKRGVPAWAWIAVAVVALVGGYLALGRGGSSTEPPVEGVSSPAAAPSQETSPEPAPVAGLEPAPSQPTAPVKTLQAAPTPTDRQVASTAAPKVPVASKPSTLPPHAPSATSVVAGSRPGPAPAARSVTVPDSPKPQVAAPSGPDLGGTTGVESVAGSVPPVDSKPSVVPGTMMPIDQVDTQPVPLARTLPVYSVLARQMRVQGTVVLNVLINDKGTVEDVVIAQGVPGAGVNEAAVKAAKQWTYRPATKDGVAVKVWKSEFVAFKL